MENSKRFIDAFVAIEMYLKERVPLEHTSFSQMVYRVSKDHKMVAHFANDLIEFAQLRNAITHSRVDGDEVIAEPHDSVVLEIEAVLKAITQVKRLRDIFSQTVYKVDLKDSLSDVLREKRARHFSVVPVYRDGAYVGMVHDALFRRCFEAQGGVVSLTSLTELLAFQEPKDRVVFMDSDARLIDAIEIFNEHQSKGTRLIALVLSDKGHPSAEPRLILTLADLPKIISNLNN